jgi:hypothetical protein
MASITILKGDPATGKLTLDCPNRIKVNKKETIHWKIDDDSGVKSISNIQVKAAPSSNVIFSEIPSRNGSSGNWKAKIDKDSPDNSEFHYSIFWEPEEGTDPNPDIPIKEHDPIIAVKPSPSILRFIILLLLSLLGLSALTLYLKKKVTKKR